MEVGQSPPVLRGTLSLAVLELWEGFYVRAGRSRSSRPPETSASADVEPVRAQVTVRRWLFMENGKRNRAAPQEAERRPAEGLA